MFSMILIVMLVVTLFNLSAFAWCGPRGSKCNSHYSYRTSARAHNFYNDTLHLKQRQLQLGGKLLQLSAKADPETTVKLKRQQERLQLRKEIRKRINNCKVYNKYGMNMYRS